MKPKWLGLLALVVVVLVSFAELGLWQLNVARDEGHEEAAAQARAKPPVELTSQLAPHTQMSGDLAGRTVTVTGTYDAQRTLVVAGRRLGEATGYWIVTPLVVDDPSGSADDAGRLAIVRGFTTDPAAAAAPAAGTVSLAGILAPGEAAPDKPVALPPGQVASVDLAALVNQWPGELYNAMLFPTQQTPPATDGLTVIPPPDFVSGELNWRNLAYALQWWIFALFALYMWWRMVREEHERLRHAETALTDGTRDDPTPESSPESSPQSSPTPSVGGPS